jgi:hypothetical protein
LTGEAPRCVSWREFAIDSRAVMVFPVTNA